MNVLITNGAFLSDIRDMILSVNKRAKITNEFNKNLKYDLVVFSGGVDINPEIYGEKNVASYFSISRDEYEIYILDNIIGRTKIFGICRGLQLISAYIYKLKLIQDINPPHYSEHTLDINKFNVGKVNSIHHQGLPLQNNLPFEVLATHRGIVEGFIDNKLNIFAVQFHPELIYMKNFMKGFYDKMKQFILE